VNDLADALRDAAKALEAAEDALRQHFTKERDAVHHEIIQAGANVGRALHLIGEVR
jgi:flagellar biosynthesis/type III secretory pathway protein FliH